MNSRQTLRTALIALEASSGSHHTRRGDHLELVVEIGLPESIIPLIRIIPRGKGMAGQAWLTQTPTTTCNLKTDRQAPIEPGARLVDARSAVAIPVCGPQDTLLGVVGFAFADDRGFDEHRLAQCRVWARYVVDQQVADVPTQQAD